MYAIIMTGGKQYRVSEGDVITVEKLEAEVGATVTINEVLILGGETLTVGAPYVEGAAVKAEVLENGKGKKVWSYKYKAKKDQHSKQGHRQPYTKLEIKSIAASGEEAPAKSLKSLKKDELLELAKSKGIEVSAKLTKDEIIAAIEAETK